MFRMDGSAVTIQQCGTLDVQMAGLTFSVEAAVFDLRAVLPAELPPLDGIISLHTFQGRSFTIDLAANRCGLLWITVNPRASESVQTNQ